MDEDTERARIEALAQHLLREGHVNDEAGARLAAIELLLAQDEASEGSGAAAG
jgi:hypothetical protein